MSLTIELNGEHRELPVGASVASVVEQYGGDLRGRGIAVAVEGEVVPRSAWGSTELVDGARVEVVAAVQGG